MRHVLHEIPMLRSMSDAAKSLLPPRLGLHEARKTGAVTGSSLLCRRSPFFSDTESDLPGAAEMPHFPRLPTKTGQGLASSGATTAAGRNSGKRTEDCSQARQQQLYFFS